MIPMRSIGFIDEWETPQALFVSLDMEFHFTVDVCASKDNAKCEKFYTREDNALDKEWSGVCWMNPPYGSGILQWIRKAYQSSLKGAVVVCLLPSRTSTRWFHDYCIKGEIRFLRKRIHFGGHKSAAPFGTMIVIFRPDVKPVFKSVYD